MNRKDGRALAKATLDALDVFKKVNTSERGSFGGLSPVAEVHSKSLSLIEDARASLTSPVEIFITIYIARAKGDEDAVEDRLDDLVRLAARALAEAFAPFTEHLQIVSASGYPERPRELDGQTYRMERFAVRFDDDGE